MAGRPNAHCVVTGGFIRIGEKQISAIKEREISNSDGLWDHARVIYFLTVYTHVSQRGRTESVRLCMPTNAPDATVT